MIWIRDEFGNLHEATHICKAAADSGLCCITLDGLEATQSYPLDVIEIVMADVAAKVREGVRFIDLEEIIREVRADMAEPLPTGMHPAPEQTGPETIH